MLAAITRLSGRIVVATWRDDTVTDFVDLPTPPDDCEWLELTQELYDSLSEIINSAGRFMHRLIDDPDPQGTYIKVRNLREKNFYAICNSTTRAIVALDRAVPDFLNPGDEIVEISQTDFLLLSQSDLRHDSEGLIPNKNCASDGTVTPRIDTRPVLQVEQPDGAVAGSPITINFALEDSDGAPMSVTASREIILRSVEGDKLVKVNLVNGIKTVTPTLSAGRYELMTADPIVYRIDGDVVLNVSEAWA